MAGARNMCPETGINTSLDFHCRPEEYANIIENREKILKTLALD
jgi:hypothetical protein